MIFKSKHFLEGVELFNQGKFFEAHEEWEELWRSMEKEHELRNLVRGLIMLSASYHKYFVQENPYGTLKLLNKSEAHIRPYKEGSFPFNLLEIYDTILANIKRVQEGKPPIIVKITLNS